MRSNPVQIDVIIVFRQGCLLGLAMAISALCEEGKTESRAHVSLMFDKLFDLMEKSEDKDTAYQVRYSFYGKSLSGKIQPIRYCKIQHIRKSNAY